MEGLTVYANSSDDEETGDGNEGQATPNTTSDIDPSKASEVIARQKDKFPLNSAPYVPFRVSESIVFGKVLFWLGIAR